MQQAVEKLCGVPVSGWKIAATSVDGQRHINVDGPLAGRIYQDRVLPVGATISLDKNLMGVAEIEFAFRLGKTLSPRATAYTVDGGYDITFTSAPPDGMPINVIHTQN